jgi:glutathione peroxidase-family protein
MGGGKSSCANPFKSLYEIPVQTLSGPTTLQEYRGKVLMIVNVASK